MKHLALLTLAALSLVSCGGGGGVTPLPRTLAGGTWNWTFYEQPGGERLGCTANPQPDPCGTSWSFNENVLLDSGRRYELEGDSLRFYDADGVTIAETTTFRWINDNEFAERRDGNPDWEIWVRTR